MQARRITVVGLAVVGLGVSLGSPAEAQQAAGMYQPPPVSEPAQPQAPPPPYQLQPAAGQPYQLQPAPGQPYPQQLEPAQPYPGQPYPQQPAQLPPYYPAQPESGTQPRYVQFTRTPLRYERRPRRNLVIGGGLTLGLAYTITAVIAASYADSLYSYDEYTHRNSISSSGGSFGLTSNLWPLYIPVLGPWIEMAYLYGNGSGLGSTLLAIDGLVQAGGLAVLIVGAVSRSRVAVYAKNSLTVSPLTLTSGSGILVGGRF